MLADSLGGSSSSFAEGSALPVEDLDTDFISGFSLQRSDNELEK